MCEIGHARRDAPGRRLNGHVFEYFDQGVSHVVKGVCGEARVCRHHGLCRRKDVIYRRYDDEQQVFEVHVLCVEDEFGSLDEN